MQIHKEMDKGQLLGKPIKVMYKNYRGEVAERAIVPQKIFWGSTDWHKDEQWLLEVFDVDRDAVRVYALCDIQEWFFI